MKTIDTYEKVVGELSEKMMEFPWSNKDAYAGFLAQTYYYTRHSTKLLTLAAARFDFSDYDFHRRFIAHSQEERGHEFMCEKDLSVMGYDIKKFQESTATAAFYQRQYYLIEHVDPVCFLGYVLSLEGLSAKGAGKAKIQVAKYHPEKATLFLRAHSDEDPDHIEKAFKMLEGLSPSRLALVESNLVQSSELYAEMMDEVRHGLKVQGKKAA